MSDRPFSFPVRVKPSGSHPLKGPYLATLDEQGLRLSRKREEVLIPLQTPASHVAGNRLRVHHDDAVVELSINKLGWYTERLARDLADSLNGSGPRPEPAD